MAGLDPNEVLETEDPFERAVQEAIAARSEKIIEDRMRMQARMTANDVAKGLFG